MYVNITTETSTKIKPIAPEVAKQFLEDYYHKLALRTEKRLSDDSGRRSRGSKSKAKRRCVSFNQTDLQRNKMKGTSSEGRETCTHIRRMSVDVGLFLGQKGLQMRSRGRGSLELSPTQGTVTRETASSNSNSGSTGAATERDKGGSKVEEKAVKNGGKKKGSRRLKRSFRLRSTEEEDVSDGFSQQTTQSQIPAPRNRQGRFRGSLKKTSSEEASGMVDSGSMVSMVSIVDIKDNPASKTEKKSKFGGAFPRRQWSWKLKKTEYETETPPQETYQSHQRSSSLEEVSPTSLTQTGDSWSGHTPNRAFSGHTPCSAPNKALSGHVPNKDFTGHTHSHTHNKP